jgi:hypothetical protein
MPAGGGTGLCPHGALAPSGRKVGAGNRPQNRTTALRFRARPPGALPFYGHARVGHRHGLGRPARLSFSAREGIPPTGPGVLPGWARPRRGPADAGQPPTAARGHAGRSRSWAEGDNGVGIVQGRGRWRRGEPSRPRRLSVMAPLMARPREARRGALRHPFLGVCTPAFRRGRHASSSCQPKRPRWRPTGLAGPSA